MTKCAELLNQTIEVDFVDINVGCPIDLVYKKVRRSPACFVSPVSPSLEMLQVLPASPEQKAAVEQLQAASSLCEEAENLDSAAFCPPGRRLCPDDSDQQV